MTNVTLQHPRRFSLEQTSASSTVAGTPPSPPLLPPQLSHRFSTISQNPPLNSSSRNRSRRLSSPIDQVLQTRKNLAHGPTAAAKRFFAQVATSSKRNISYSNIMPSISLETARAGPIGGGTSGIPSHAESLLRLAPAVTGRPRSRSTNSIRPNTRCSYPSPPGEKPIASTSGGALSMTIHLAEPVLFLSGYVRDDYSNRTPAMLRGSLVVKIAKNTKIKAITLSFRGKARTEWPEGIPPRKSEYFEEKDIMTHHWPFFNAQFATAELGHCADSCRLYNRPGASESDLSVGSAIARSASPVGIAAGSSTSAADRRLSLQLVPARSFGKGDNPNSGSVVSRGYRVFQPGEYIYNFELPIESCMPETIETDLGSVKYELEAVIDRSGTFRSKLSGKKDVIMIRTPSESSLEATEPIAISRTWEDQMHYDIVISGKSFPLGSKIPIAFKLTPLAKVRCHRIKIFITENIEYYGKNKKVHRIDPTKKVLLLEKRADGTVTSAFSGSSVTTVSGGGSSGGSVGPSSGSSPNPNTGTWDNLLGPLNGESNIGPTEMEFNVQLPGCNAKEKDRIHFDTTYKDIQVHHWIKIVMRLSKADPNDPSKRRHFEISIDSPFHILSCLATQANTALPAYGDNSTYSFRSNHPPCSCPPLNRRNSPKDGTTSLYSTAVALPPHSIPRPMHLLRVPSHNPPPFDADSPPPPLMTPPPQYDSIITSSNALADYFSRLADEDTDEDTTAVRTGGRARGLSLPLTPGGRVARSMDEIRTWDAHGNPS